jgi:Flp pilus assembly protein TadD
MGFEVVDQPPISSSVSSAKAEELLRPLRDAVRANRESARAHYALAETQYYLGRFEAAWNEIYNATLLDPTDQELHYLMAVMTRFLPDLPAADNYRARIIFDGTYRDSAENYLAYGSMLLAEGFDAKAMEVFNDAVHRYPANSRAYHGLAWAQLGAGKLKEARASAEKALQLEPGSREIADRLRIIMDAQRR